jgi:hypothetical protein
MLVVWSSFFRLDFTLLRLFYIVFQDWPLLEQLPLQKSSLQITSSLPSIRFDKAVHLPSEIHFLEL